MLHTGRACQAYMRRHPGRLSELYLGWFLHTLDGCVRVVPMSAPTRILRLRSSGFVNCKDIHVEFGLRLPCAHCRNGRLADEAARANVESELMQRAHLGARVVENCFNGTVAAAAGHERARTLRWLMGHARAGAQRWQTAN